MHLKLACQPLTKKEEEEETAEEEEDEEGEGEEEEVESEEEKETVKSCVHRLSIDSGLCGVDGTEKFSAELREF